MTVVHLPPVQRRLVAWAVARVEVSAGLVVTMDGVSFNLFTLEADARGVTAAASVSPGEPFLRAERVGIRVPLAILAGPLRIDRVDASGVSMTIVRRADGSMNLPEGGEAGGDTGGGAAPDIGTIDIADASVSYRDEAAGVDVDASGVRLSLAAANGSLTGRVEADRLTVSGAGETIRDATASADVRYDGGSTVTLDRLAYAAAFEGGELTASGRFTTVPLQLDGRAAWSGVQTARLTGSYAPLTVAARVTGTADISWPIDQGLAGLDLSIDNRAEADQRGGALAVTGTATLSLAGAAWTLRQAHEVAGAIAESGDLRGRLDAGDLSGSTIDGALDLRSDNIARALDALGRAGLDLPEAARPDAGRLRARVTLGGTLADPSLAGNATLTDARLLDLAPLSASSSFTVTGAGVGNPAVAGSLDLDVPPLAGEPIGRVTARVTYADGRLRASDIGLQQADGGRLSGDVAFTPASGAYAVTARVEGVSIASPEIGGDVYPLTARLDGEFSGRGTIDRPGGSGALRFSTLTWDGTALAPATLDLDLGPSGVAFHARLPDIQTAVDGTASLDAPHAFEATATAEAADIRRLLALVPREWPAIVDELSGSVSASATAKGRLDALDESAYSAELRDADLALGDARLSLDRPAAVRFDGGRVEVDGLAFRTGTTTVVVDGALGPGAASGTITLGVDGRLEDARPWLALAGVPDDLVLTGGVAGTLSASGTVERPDVSGRVTIRDGRAGWAAYPAASGIEIDATIADGVIDAGSITARWEGAEASGQMRLPLALVSERLAPEATPGSSPSPPMATLSARVDGLTERALDYFVEPDPDRTLTGRATARIDLQADALDLDRLRGTVILDDFSLDADGVAVTQARPTRFEIAGGSIGVTDLDWQAEGNQFTVTGSATLGDSGALDLRANGRLDLRVLGAALPGVTTAGVADIAIRVSGTSASPLADGTADISGAQIRVADPQIAATGVEGRLVLSGQRVTIDRVRGSLNGGAFTATGALDRGPAGSFTGAINLTATDVALNVPEGLRTQVAPDVTLTLAGDRARLSGTVVIERGAYREPLSLAMGFVAAARERASEIVPAGPTPFAERLDLDVALESHEDLIVDNNYGRMRISVDVRLVGTAARPAAVGRATIREGGVLYLGGRVYQIERGSIDFSNPRAIVPDLDLLARTRISGVDVSLAIAGTADTVKGTLSSDPPHSQTDIVSLLVTGRLADEAGGAVTSVASSQVLAYLSGEALGFAAEAIGLDTLRIERGTGVDALRSDPALIAGDTNPSTRLTVSKRFSTYAEVILSRNLSDGRFAWVAAITPGHNVELRALSLDDATRLYEIRHDLSFGGPARAPASEASRNERVSAVTFTGDTGVPERDLRGLLSLDAGDRYDFYRWQDDRDRLRRFYLDRGRFQAQVDAHRTEPGDGTVALEYDVQPGPLTVIDIDGYDLSRGARDRLDEIWSDAIFDEALIADLRDAVLVDLADAGYLRAQVDVSRPSDPTASGDTHVRITIDPGPRSTSRHVEISGASRISEGRIEALVSPDDWRLPAQLASDAEALYRSEGMLAASVAAGPVEFDEGRAVLPVRVTEGPVFTVSAVSFSGLAARSEDEVRAAFPLAPAATYSSAALDGARRALEVDYASHGFNTAAVFTEAAIDRDAGTVAVAVRIEEGPQQVLERVTVAGAGGIEPGVVTGALHLEAGTPVNLEQWYGARRRVFDLGLFRSVDVEPKPIEGGAAEPGVEHVEALVTLVRQPPWRLRYGFDISDEPAPAADARAFGAGASVDLQRRGLFGHAATLGAAARVDNNDRVGRGYLTFPTLYGRAVKSSVFLERSRQLIGQAGFLSIVADKTTLTAEQRLPAWRKIQLAYGYQFEWNHTRFDADPNDPFGILFDETSKEARLTTTALVDTRRDPFDARRGIFHSSNIEYGASALGSDVRFLKYVLQQFAYVPIGPVVAASGVRLGVGVGFGQQLLASERFFAGGVNTVRGYPEDSLGGVDFLGDPAGGQSMVVLNQELRFPIFRWVHAAGFIDAGNVFERARDLSFTDLAVGAGGGLRLQTPVGLVRVDFGVPVPRKARGVRVYFSFGQLF